MIFPHIAVRTPILPKRDLNYRSRSECYEPDELPGCSTPHIHYSGRVRPRQIAAKISMGGPLGSFKLLSELCEMRFTIKRNSWRAFVTFDNELLLITDMAEKTSRASNLSQPSLHSPDHTEILSTTFMLIFRFLWPQSFGGARVGVPGQALHFLTELLLQQVGHSGDAKAVGRVASRLLLPRSLKATLPLEGGTPAFNCHSVLFDSSPRPAQVTF